VEKPGLLLLLALSLGLGNGLKQKSPAGISGRSLSLDCNVVGFLEGGASLVEYCFLQVLMETHNKHSGLEPVVHLIAGQFIGVVPSGSTRTSAEASGMLSTKYWRFWHLRMKNWKMDSSGPCSAFFIQSEL